VPKLLVSDALWEQVEPLLPKHRPSPKGGAPRQKDRKCLEGIIYVLKTGCQWQALPHSDRWPSGSTCWRRHAEWTAAGLWPALHQKLLNVLGKAGQIDLDKAVVDSASVRALFGGAIPAPTPRIEANTAANATSSAIRQASRCW
jgi:transposase